MSTTIELQQQIDELQIRLAHQEDLLEALNQMVAKQNDTIGRLSARLQENQAKLEVLNDTVNKPAVEKPPHY